MRLITYLLINGLAVFIASGILPGVHIDSFLTAIIVAVILGVINMFIKPILIFLTLPITILTLGLFTFVINAFLVMITDIAVSGFRVDGFLWALLFSLVAAVLTSFFNSFVKE